MDTRKVAKAGPTPGARPCGPDGPRIHRSWAVDTDNHVRSSSRLDESAAALLADQVGACRGLSGLVGAAVTQPLSTPVPSDDIAYLRRKGCVKLAFRIARRRLQFALSGQRSLLRQAIDPTWTRLLWIHTEAPQLGDLLMDLAPRSLLSEQGRTVDVYAAPHLAQLLEGDRWIGRSLSTPAQVDATRYDAVITSSHVTRALHLKQQRTPRLPWVALAGDYTVPDYHRALFNTRRLADLTGAQLSADALARHARQKLDAGGVPVVVQPPGTVAIAVGGVRADRTYPHWDAVVTALATAGVARIVLVGSANGRTAADDIQRVNAGRLQIDDAVDGGDLARAQRLIAGCALVLCADGGLLHLALTTPTPVVALFNAAVDPHWRMPVDFTGVALQSTTRTVGDLPPAAIAQAALRRLHGRDSETAT